MAHLQQLISAKKLPCSDHPLNGPQDADLDDRAEEVGLRPEPGRRWSYFIALAKDRVLQPLALGPSKVAPMK
jgi:hypothetical protein